MMRFTAFIACVASAAAFAPGAMTGRSHTSALTHCWPLPPYRVLSSHEKRIFVMPSLLRSKCCEREYRSIILIRTKYRSLELRAALPQAAARPVVSLHYSAQTSEE
jgi:hypothetical protein